MVASASGHSPNAVDPDATLTIGARVDNNSFDPADLEIGNRVQYWQPVYDTLLRLDADGVPQPNLATEWTYNDDNSVLSLQLRDDVTFTDGSMVGAVQRWIPLRASRLVMATDGRWWEYGGTSGARG